VPCGFTAGVDSAIRKDNAKNAGRKTVLSGAEMNRLIQLEIDQDPDRVGLPIRILRIDSNGPRWIQNGEDCNLGIDGEKTPPTKHH
jgi:hypothetical protein